MIKLLAKIESIRGRVYLGKDEFSSRYAEFINTIQV